MIDTPKKLIDVKWKRDGKELLLACFCRFLLSYGIRL